jgi:hypothetical protein
VHNLDGDRAAAGAAAEVDPAHGLGTEPTEQAVRLAPHAGGFTDPERLYEVPSPCSVVTLASK